jgi:hypothetical protein
MKGKDAKAFEVVVDGSILLEKMDDLPKDKAVEDHAVTVVDPQVRQKTQTGEEKKEEEEGVDEDEAETSLDLKPVKFVKTEMTLGLQALVLQNIGLAINKLKSALPAIHRLLEDGNVFDTDRASVTKGIEAMINLREQMYKDGALQDGISEILTNMNAVTSVADVQERLVQFADNKLTNAKKVLDAPPDAVTPDQRRDAMIEENDAEKMKESAPAVATELVKPSDDGSETPCPPWEALLADATNRFSFSKYLNLVFKGDGIDILLMLHRILLMCTSLPVVRKHVDPIPLRETVGCTSISFGDAVTLFQKAPLAFDAVHFMGQLLQQMMLVPPFPAVTTTNPMDGSTMELLAAQRSARDAMMSAIESGTTRASALMEAAVEDSTVRALFAFADEYLRNFLESAVAMDKRMLIQQFVSLFARSMWKNCVQSNRLLISEAPFLAIGAQQFQPVKFQIELEGATAAVKAAGVPGVLQSADMRTFIANMFGVQEAELGLNTSLLATLGSVAPVGSSMLNWLGFGDLLAQFGYFSAMLHACEDGSIKDLFPGMSDATKGRLQEMLRTLVRDVQPMFDEMLATVVRRVGLMFEGINGVGLEARVGTFIPATKLAADKRSQGQKADVEVYQAVENEFGKDIKLAFSQMGIGAAKLEWTDTPSDDTLLVDVAAMSADGAELALELAGGSSETMETLA